MRDKYLQILSEFGPGCRLSVPAAEFTTYKAGGPADVLCKPSCREELARLGVFCSQNGVPFRVLGAGSNVLVSDKGLCGVTALTVAMNKIKISGHVLKAQAGALWDDLVKVSVEAGLSGLEKTSGIPGTVGGAVFMNAGAFGQETFDRLERIETMDGSGAIKSFAKSDLKYGYRKVDGLEGLTVLSAEFRLEPGDGRALAAERACVLSRRAEKQPLDLPSAGSVFKRPTGDFASRLIDAAGLKGLRIGSAQVSQKHAGFIVNLGGATARDIHALMLKIKADVKAGTGVELELEQILLGEFD